MLIKRLLCGWIYIFLIVVSYGQSDFRVLHFSKTSGFDHGTRQNSLLMFQNMGMAHGFTVDDDQTGAAFDSLSHLQQYAVVIFSNTSGDQILNATQRANFEAYINNGGALIGIHAASDTYRHSTANGAETGTWDWYAEILGGSVQVSPHHTNADHSGIMDKLVEHPITAGLPDPWEKVEEYYYWENGFLDSSNINLLQVRSTGANSYDAPRPMSWYKILPGGGKSFYTALGHANSNFTHDTIFQNHLRNAVLWAANITSIAVSPEAKGPYTLYPNPTAGALYITSSTAINNASYRILDISGKLVAKGVVSFVQHQAGLQVGHLSAGPYILEITSEPDFSRISLPFIIR